MIEIPDALKDPTSKQTSEVKITDILKTFADLKSRVETNSIRMNSVQNKIQQFTNQAEGIQILIQTSE